MVNPTTTYISDTFKVPGIDNANPTLYVIDTAQDDAGNDYFLTIHGKIIDANDNLIPRTTSPR